MTNFETYGEYISYLRKKRALTQSEVAELMNLSVQTLSKYENGINKISLAYASEFAKILGVDLTSFINKIDKKNNECCELRSFDFNKLSVSLTYFRKKSFLTQQDVADKLNISKSRVCKMENGYIVPYIDEFIKLKDMYNVNSYERLYFNLNLKEEFLLVNRFNNNPSLNNKVNVIR